jgi:hypothetical protein
VTDGKSESYFFDLGYEEKSGVCIGCLLGAS